MITIKRHLREWAASTLAVLASAAYGVLVTGQPATSWALGLAIFAAFTMVARWSRVRHNRRERALAVAASLPHCWRECEGPNHAKCPGRVGVFDHHVDEFAAARA